MQGEMRAGRQGVATVPASAISRMVASEPYPCDRPTGLMA